MADFCFSLASAGGKPLPEPFHMHFVIVTDQKRGEQEDVMGRGLLLWLLGIPIPIIILIWVLGGLHG